MRERRLRRLARFHALIQGDDDGRAWWPLAIRRLPLAQRLDMAEDGAYMDHWAEAERRRADADMPYFVEAYGHVAAAVQGAPPIPFKLWPPVESAAERCIGARCQREVLEAFLAENLLVVLKARQLGLTWLALHFAYWLMARNPETPRAKVLALSKKEDDATKLLRRLRRINALLPPYMALAEDKDTRGSLTRYKLAGRGECQSLVSNPDAARSEQADLFLWDEAAFTRNQGFEDTWTAAESTLGDFGRAILISTGNGSEEVPGDGQGFAQLFGKALVGEDGMRAIFLPDDVHPARNEEWAQRARKRYLTEERFQAEHPLVVSEALQGKQGAKVYPLDGIAAAAQLGAEFDARLAAGKLPAPTGVADGMLAVGIDWGQFSHMLPVWELEDGGLYIPPGEHASFAMEVSEKSGAFLDGVRELVQSNGDGKKLWPPIGVARFDAAGVEQMRSFVNYVVARPKVREAWVVRRSRSPRVPLRLKLTPVPFGAEPKSGGGTRRGTYKSESIEYLRFLFGRSRQAVQGGERWGIIAISPRNKELLRQLRGLEFLDDGTGRIKKADDHGPDALIAGVAPIAAEHRDRLPAPDEDEVGAAA